MSLQVGDTVKIVGVIEREDEQVVGRVGNITKIDTDEDEYPYYVDHMPSNSWHFAAKQLKLISKKGDTAMSTTKLYRVMKDHPVWEVGAILKNEDSSGYQVINDLYLKEIKDLSSYSEMEAVIENNPDWFERVYEVGVLKKLKYLTKSEARKADTELYKAK